MHFLKFMIFLVVAPVFLDMTPVRAAEPQTLAQAWVAAYRNNPSLEAERAKLRVTDEGVAQALSHWRPGVTASANVGKTYQYTPPNNGYPSNYFAKGGDSYSVQVTQPIFRGFRTLTETDAAEEQVMAGRAHLRSMEAQLLLDTGKAFLDTLRDRTIVQLYRDEERVLQKKLDETTVRSAAGDLTQTDVRQAETRLARAQVTRLQAENTLEADRAAFLRLVGEEPGNLKEPFLPLEPARDLDTVQHLAETANPSVIAAQHNVEAAKAEISFNKGSLLPEVNLVASTAHYYGQSMTFPGHQDNQQVMVQASLPLYDGGSSYSKVRAARQAATRYRMELAEARHKAHEFARRAWQAMSIAEASIRANRAGIEAAGQALEGVKTENRVGARTTLDVLNAEQELLDARIAMAQARHDRDYALLELEAAVGELTAKALHLPTETYDPERHYDDNAGKLIGFGDEDRYVVGEKNKPSASN